MKIYISEIQFLNKYSKQTVMMTNLFLFKKCINNICQFVFLILTLIIF